MADFNCYRARYIHVYMNLLQKTSSLSIFVVFQEEKAFGMVMLVLEMHITTTKE